MNFSDHWATDGHGKEFIFRVEVQRKLSEMGLPIIPDSLDHLVPNQSAHTTERQSHQHFESKPEAEHSTPSKNEFVEEDDDFEEPVAIQIDPETGKYLGRIKWYNFTKGYGFISRGGGEDIFFHKTDVVADPQELDRGKWVLYDVEETPKGFEASEVSLSSQ
ncbi:MAG: cold shock domain-containing protein [Chloroflexota bacterium]